MHNTRLQVAALSEVGMRAGTHLLPPAPEAGSGASQPQPAPPAHTSPPQPRRDQPQGSGQDDQQLAAPAPMQSFQLSALLHAISSAAAGARSAADDEEESGESTSSSDEAEAGANAGVALVVDEDRLTVRVVACSESDDEAGSTWPAGQAGSRTDEWVAALRQHLRRDMEGVFREVRPGRCRGPHVMQWCRTGIMSSDQTLAAGASACCFCCGVQD